MYKFGLVSLFTCLIFVPGLLAELLATPFQVVLDDGTSLTFDLHEGETISAAIERLMTEHSLPPEVYKKKLTGKIASSLQDGSQIPLMKMDGIRIGAHVFSYEYFAEEDVQRRLYAKTEGFPRNPFDFIDAVNQIEQILDQNDVKVGERRFPLGTLGFPKLQRRLFHSFSAVKFVVGNETKINVFAEVMDRIIYVLEKSRTSFSFVAAADQVRVPIMRIRPEEVDPFDADSLYVIPPLTFFRTLPPYFIALELEQFIQVPISSAMKTFGKSYVRKLQAALEVWEWSKSNIPHLRRHGVERIRFVPLGITPPEVGASAIPLERRDLHVSFYGIMTLRRTNLLTMVSRQLKETYGVAGIKMSLFMPLFGQQRFSTIIALNVHAEPMALMEAHRILPLVANLVWVISEPSEDPWYDERLSKVVDLVSTEKIVPRIIEVLAMDPADLQKELERRQKVLLEDFEISRLFTESGALDWIKQCQTPKRSLKEENDLLERRKSPAFCTSPEPSKIGPEEKGTESPASHSPPKLVLRSIPMNIPGQPVLDQFGSGTK